MADYGLPVLYALFIWWFSTGLILYLDGLPRWTFRWSMAAATVVLVLALVALTKTRTDVSIAGAYCSFTCGLMVWGWHEIAFLLGYVTGPYRRPCPPECRGVRRLMLAIATILYHELAILVTAIAMLALTWEAPNQVGTWTFLVLWWMRLSAKLNVFLGVRNLNEEFLPDHLRYLETFFTRRPMNLLFPVSVTVATVVAVWLVWRAGAADADPFTVTGLTFLATLVILATIEHWFLVAPLPATALWRWGLRSRGSAPRVEIDIVAGFLGAGKTTFVRRTLAGEGTGVRTVALVNDFSAVGVDGALLRGGGAADVVELGDGCLCCSLKGDLASQIRAIVARAAPDRLVIEPSGVADVPALIGAFGNPALKPLVERVHLYAVIDAAAFLRDYARMPGYFRDQAALTPVFVVNKTDLASETEVAAVTETLRTLNPAAPVVAARYGAVAPGARAALSGAAALPVTPPPRAGDHHCADHDDGTTDPDAAGERAFGMTSWSTHLTGPYDPQGLRALLDAVAHGCFGDVARVKGIARAGAGWVRFDLAGGRASLAAYAPANCDEPARVAAIGRTVDTAGLSAAFAACAAAPAAGGG